MAGVLSRFPRLVISNPRHVALLASIAALAGVTAFWGFTVDDALITARVAYQLASGHGYRFNPTGPVVDAVTPLGWVFLLVPFAKSGPMAAFAAARAIGGIAWIASAAWLGASIVRRGGSMVPLVLVPLISPVGLWACSGMETGAVMGLLTFATARGSAGLWCAGLAAAWRPELIPFALVLSLGRSKNLGVAARNLGSVTCLPLLVGLVRWWCFGSPRPLAVAAKPSDAMHGFWYAFEALIWTGPIWLWLTLGVFPWLCDRIKRKPSSGMDEPAVGSAAASYEPKLERRLEREEFTLALAIGAHFVSVTLAGGDWMPAYRLVAPVMPAMLRVACHLPRPRRRVVTLIGYSMALLAIGHISWRLAPRARRIVEQRNLLIREAKTLLNSASVVAAPDVGWVGVAHAGEIVDLAGVTDPTIANLPGGHTSKRIEHGLFSSRQIDRVIVLLAPNAVLAEPWTESKFARVIDWRASRLASEFGCTPRRSILIPFTEQRYLVLECPKT